MPTPLTKKPPRPADPRYVAALDDILTPFAQRVDLVRANEPATDRVRVVFDKAIARVDTAKFAEIQDWVRSDSQRLMTLPAFKYLDIPYYLIKKAAKIVALDLDILPPHRILDLGAGAGHFPFLARSFGHEIVGIDMQNELYARLLDLYGVERRVQMITPGADLVECGRFNLITSLQTTFNRPVGRGAVGRESLYWTLAEWTWFFDQLCSRLDVPGRIFFELNKQLWPDSGADHALELMNRFERNGATVDRQRHTVLFNLAAPLNLLA